MNRIIVVLLFASLASAQEPAASDALSIRLVRPREQGERLLSLFQGARAPHPAAALAAWKHATRGEASLGKPREALIACLNPQMVKEFGSLDDASLKLDFGSANDPIRWRLCLPSDDGTFAALAPALSLTEGAAEKPLGDVPVLRLGPPGSSLSLRGSDRLVFASSRDQLERVSVEPLAAPAALSLASGFHARLDPQGLSALTSLGARRLSTALEALACRQVEGHAGVEGDAFTIELRSQLVLPFPSKARIDPSWLQAIPASSVLAAACVALDTDAKSLDALFSILDRVEKADPIRAGLAPLRVRLNLIATAARVRLEVDLWPVLRGLTIAWLVDGQGAILALHASTEEAAGRIAREIVPRLAKPLLPHEKAANPRAERLSESLGALEGKPLQISRRGGTLLIAWGERALPLAIKAWDHPEDSAARAIQAGWQGTLPSRTGALWPGKMRTLAPAGSALAKALDESPPLVWRGISGPAQSRDTVRWTGLKAFVKGWLDALPLERPPDR